MLNLGPIKIPSKTFIIGEYLALQGTASMIMTTEPCFEFLPVQDGGELFHPESPAGMLSKKLELQDIQWKITDPYNGKGGFGRSTAEYLAVQIYWMAYKREFQNPREALLDNLTDLVSTYKSFSISETQPSGADMVAQLCGGICWYDGMNFQAQDLEWPFPGYSLTVFHTGKKIPTHDHLSKLGELELHSLIPTVVSARTSFAQANLKVFAHAINYYYDQLYAMGLSDPSVWKIVEELRTYPQILAAKGCGAMGVDTVLVLCESSDLAAVKKLASTYDLEWIASTDELCGGASLDLGGQQ